MSRDRMRATAPVVRHKDKRPNRRDRVKTDLPKAVHEFLGVEPGDQVVFEEGSTFVAEKAAARGRYCVIYVVRAPAASEHECRSEETAEAPPPRPAFNESLQETIRRLRSERP
jgi:hypothetical protein